MMDGLYMDHFGCSVPPLSTVLLSLSFDGNLFVLSPLQIYVFIVAYAFAIACYSFICSCDVICGLFVFILCLTLFV